MPRGCWLDEPGSTANSTWKTAPSSWPNSTARCDDLWREDQAAGDHDPLRTRSHSQRMAAALVEMARRSSAVDDTDDPERLDPRRVAAPRRPQFVVVVDVAAIAGDRSAVAELEDGTPVPQSALQRWLCDSTIGRVVMAGGSVPVDLGRLTYTASAAQRRALIARDRGCIVPGCRRRASMVRRASRQALSRRSDRSVEPGAPVQAPPQTGPCRRHQAAPPRCGQRLARHSPRRHASAPTTTSGVGRMSRLFDELVEEAEAAPIHGWDFGWLDGRAIEERPTWHYFDLVAQRAPMVGALLDLQVGSGGMIAALPSIPRLTVGTEGYAPNVPGRGTTAGSTRCSPGPHGRDPSRLSLRRRLVRARHEPPSGRHVVGRDRTGPRARRCLPVAASRAAHRWRVVGGVARTSG